MHPLEPVQIVNIASTLAFVPLAVWVLLADRRELANIAFAGHVLAFAAAISVHNLNVGTHILEGTDLLWRIESALFLLIAASLVLLALRLPKPARRRDLPWAILATSLGVILFALDRSVWGVFVATTWGTLLFIATRWRSFATRDERASAALVSAAIALFLSFQAGAGTINATGFTAWGFAKSAMPFILASAWLWNAARGGGRPATLAAWAMLAAFLAGMLEGAMAATGEDLWGYTILRIFSVVLLAYAVVRHQVLGAHVKLRFAISKSTIAAAFIAVFFIASEAAQQFFGETLNSNYLGILAAGALVFAIAPLSRVADRLAEKAVPLAPVTEATADPDREQMYRSAVRFALRERRLTRSEERELFRLARGLGLESNRAHEILAETEELEGKTD